MKRAVRCVGFLACVGFGLAGCEGEASSMSSGARGQRVDTPPAPLAVSESVTPMPSAVVPVVAPSGEGLAVAMKHAQGMTSKGVLEALNALNAAHQQVVSEVEQGPSVFTLAAGAHLERGGVAFGALVASIPRLEDPAEVHKAPNAAGKPPKGAPRNTRQVREGYWLGSRPDAASEIAALHSAGVRAIISAVGVEDDVADAMRKYGIEHLSIFFGRKFPATEKILGVVDRFPADAVYVHCEYGGDRSGVLMAFLLSVRHGWRPDHALLAMTIAEPKDIEGLVEVLASEGLHITDAEIKAHLSAYSGRFGGLKVRNHGYKTLVRSTLEAMSKHGVVVHDLPSEAEEKSQADAKKTSQRLGADYDDD